MSEYNWIGLYIVIASLLIVATDIMRRITNYRFLLKQPTVILELTPPSFSQKTPLATEQLFSVLQSLGMAHSWRDKLLDRKQVVSFEVVSTRTSGIRYLVRIAVAEQPVFEQQLAAYLPGVQFSVVDDYIPASTDTQFMSVSEFTQAKHFAYALASHDSLAQNDPIDQASS